MQIILYIYDASEMQFILYIYDVSEMQVILYIYDVGEMQSILASQSQCRNNRNERIIIIMIVVKL